MKRYIIVIIVTILVAASCTPYKKAAESRQLKESVQQENILKAIETQNYVIRVDRLFARRGAPMNLRPSSNYIVVSNDYARINLAYVGRSYDIRGIAAINLSGEIIEKEMNQRKNGQMELKLKVKQKSDIFKVNIQVSRSGSCNINITHPRIDNISYRGNMATIG